MANIVDFDPISRMTPAEVLSVRRIIVGSDYDESGKLVVRTSRITQAEELKLVGLLERHMFNDD